MCVNRSKMSCPLILIESYEKFVGYWTENIGSNSITHEQRWCNVNNTFFLPSHRYPNWRPLINQQKIYRSKIAWFSNLSSWHLPSSFHLSHNLWDIWYSMGKFNSPLVPYIVIILREKEEIDHVKLFLLEQKLAFHEKQVVVSI